MSSKQATPKGQQSSRNASTHSTAFALCQEVPKPTESPGASSLIARPQKVPHTELKPSSYSIEHWLQQNWCEDPWSAVSSFGAQLPNTDQTMNMPDVTKKEDESVNFGENKRARTINASHFDDGKNKFTGWCRRI
ncbi:MAG: hypothetical protein Q9191_000024 [Dirinaria sp. TL-2023a]